MNIWHICTYLILFMHFCTQSGYNGYPYAILSDVVCVTAFIYVSMFLLYLLNVPFGLTVVLFSGWAISYQIYFSNILHIYCHFTDNLNKMAWKPFVIYIVFSIIIQWGMVTEAYNVINTENHFYFPLSNLNRLNVLWMCTIQTWICKFHTLIGKIYILIGKIYTIYTK